jgi:outer membrane protein TolC
VLDAAAQSALSGRSSSSQRDARARRLTIAEAVSLAVNRNLIMAEARLNVEEKEHLRRTAFSDFFPSFTLQFIASGYKYRQTGNVQAFAMAHDSRRAASAVLNPDGTQAKSGEYSLLYGSYPFRIDPYRSFSLVGTLTQPIYSGGKLLNNYKYYRLGVDYAEIQMEVDRQDLILSVFETYYQLIKSQKLLDVANQSIVALEALRNQTMEFFKAGVVPKVDVLATEGQLAQARIQRTQSESDIQRYKAQLNYLLRYPQETPVDVVQDLDYQPPPYSIPGIYSLAASNRLEIRQASISVEQAIALARASEAALIPSVSLQVQGSRTNDDWNPLDKEAINEWKIQGIASWAFDMFRSRETVKTRRAAQANAFVARELLVEQIMRDVKQAYLDMKRAESDIQDNRKAVEYREEAFRINNERYKEQVATYTEVLDAQRQLSQAQGDYYTSLVEFKINQATLERQMGVLR